MIGHTPGPWTPDRDPRIGMEWNIHILDQRGHAICFMAHSDGASPERDEANAALVAAAPRLLEALERIASYPESRADELSIEGARKLARTALALAREG